MFHNINIYNILLYLASVKSLHCISSSNLQKTIKFLLHDYTKMIIHQVEVVQVCVKSRISVYIYPTRMSCIQYPCLWFWEGQWQRYIIELTQCWKKCVRMISSLCPVLAFLSLNIQSLLFKSLNLTPFLENDFPTLS